MIDWQLLLSDIESLLCSVETEVVEQTEDPELPGLSKRLKVNAMDDHFKGEILANVYLVVNHKPSKQSRPGNRRHETARRRRSTT